MKPWHGLFYPRKGLESSLYCYGDPVRLVRATLGVRKGIEKKLHNYGGPAKVMRVCQEAH